MSSCVSQINSFKVGLPIFFWIYSYEFVKMLIYNFVHFKILGKEIYKS